VNLFSALILFRIVKDLLFACGKTSS